MLVKIFYILTLLLVCNWLVSAAETNNWISMSIAVICGACLTSVKESILGKK